MHTTEPQTVFTTDRVHALLLEQEGYVVGLLAASLSPPRTLTSRHVKALALHRTLAFLLSNEPSSKSNKETVYLPLYLLPDDPARLVVRPVGA